MQPMPGQRPKPKARSRSGATLAILALALPACADCPDPFELRERRMLIPGQTVRLEAEDGEMRVIGRERATAIEIVATGCGAGGSAGGAAIVIDTTAGERVFRVRAARADVRVVLPAGAPVDVRHGDGDLEVRAVGPAVVQTGSGRAVVEQTIGHVRVGAGAGSLYVRSVVGDVELGDGAGGIFVEGIEGSVRVRDGSGGIHAREVLGDLIVDSDGSGEIDAVGIAGDLVVRGKSEDLRRIRHSDVGGLVLLPD